MKSLHWMLLPALVAAFLPSAAQANFLVDDFSTPTGSITQTGAGTTTSGAVSGTGIAGFRTIALTVASPLTSATSNVTGGLAEASFNGNFSSPNANSNFTLGETFATQNVSGNLLNFTAASSLGATYTITANGTSTYTLTDPASPMGTMHSVNITAFSNPSVFANLTSLTFVETFPNGSFSGPSVAFTGPIFFSPSSVPEPSSLILCATAGVFFLGRRHLARCGIA